MINEHILIQIMEEKGGVKMPVMQIKNIHTKLRCPHCSNEAWKSNRYHPMETTVKRHCPICEKMTDHVVVGHDVQVFKKGAK